MRLYEGPDVVRGATGRYDLMRWDVREESPCTEACATGVAARPAAVRVPCCSSCTSCRLPRPPVYVCAAGALCPLSPHHAHPAPALRRAPPRRVHTGALTRHVCDGDLRIRTPVTPSCPLSPWAPAPRFKGIPETCALLRNAAVLLSWTYRVLEPSLHTFAAGERFLFHCKEGTAHVYSCLGLGSSLHVYVASERCASMQHLQHTYVAIQDHSPDVAAAVAAPRPHEGLPCSPLLQAWCGGALLLLLLPPGLSSRDVQTITICLTHGYLTLHSIKILLLVLLMRCCPQAARRATCRPSATRSRWVR